MSTEDNGAVTDTSGFVNTSSAPIDVGYLVPILSDDTHDFQVTFDGAPVTFEILGVEAAAELCRRERARLGAEAFLRFPNKRHLRFRLGTIAPLGEHVVIMRHLEPAQRRLH